MVANEASLMHRPRGRRGWLRTEACSRAGCGAVRLGVWG